MGLRIGIVGCGAVAGIHVRGYRSVEDVEIVACSDISLERARKFATEKEIAKVYASYTDMMDAEKLDGISVCTPNYAHCEPTVEALKRGIHVLCEKPIAMNSEEAQIMVDAARESKHLLTI